MLIFLPLNCTQYDYFRNDLGALDFSTVHGQLYSRYVHVRIPDFEINFEIPNMQPELNKVL